jgi:hypothetical protein
MTMIHQPPSDCQRPQSEIHLLISSWNESACAIGTSRAMCILTLMNETKYNIVAAHWTLLVATFRLIHQSLHWTLLVATFRLIDRSFGFKPSTVMDLFGAKCVVHQTAFRFRTRNITVTCMKLTAFF